MNAGSVSYDFFAAAGTPNTLAAMTKWNYNCCCDFVGNPGNLSMTDFNQLQTSAMSNQSETAWATSSGTPNLIPPQVVDITSTATIVTGEVYRYPYFGFCDPGSMTSAALVTSPLPIDIALDFSWPALQPPAAAPWTIQFQQPASNGNGQWSAPGLITLNSAQSTDTTLAVSWVVQPTTALLTLGNVCPGNTSTFIPGTSVLGNAVTIVTIPTGQTQAGLSPVFEPIGDPYKVQVVAWQPTGNLQAADCITVPGQVP